MYVMDMNKEYDYYKKTIKPLEKKYNRYCILYNLFKLRTFKKLKEYYNLLLILYYKYIIDNPIYASEIIENIDKKNNR